MFLTTYLNEYLDICYLTLIALSQSDLKTQKCHDLFESFPLMNQTEDPLGTFFIQTSASKEQEEDLDDYGDDYGKEEP